MKLDIGCGPICKEGFIGVDYKKYNKNVKYVLDLNKGKLPFKENSIDEIYCAHTLEHVEKPFELAHEFYRILKKNGKCTIKVPYFRHYQAFHPHHKTFWGLGTENIFNNKYDEFDFKWASVSVSWNWVKAGEDKVLFVLNPLWNFFIRRFRGIYERKISIFFPVYELVFELTK